jgi:hypothetical protein
MNRSIRLVRSGMVWVALLALALHGFASLRGLCCDPGATKGSDCCAAQVKTTAMKMPGMNSSQMESMMGAAFAADQSIAVTTSQCWPVSDSEVPQFLVRGESAFDGSPVLTRSDHDALVWNRGDGFSSSSTLALILVEGRPPRLFLPDSLPVVLRI